MCESKIQQQRQRQQQQQQHQQQQQQEVQARLHPTGRVYLATCPLVGWEPFADALGERFPSALHLHHFVIVEQLPGLLTTRGNWSSSSNSGDNGTPCSSSSSSMAGSVVAYDFLPLDATSPLTAAVLLSGGGVPGTTRCRELRAVPRQRCQLQGLTHLPGPLAAAAAFQQRYQAQHGRLQLLRNDCTHHSERLVALLLAGGSSL
ncbi:hypothetical protein ABPG77_000810 [Micractinium sp. CCAP 211/92]